MVIKTGENSFYIGENIEDPIAIITYILTDDNKLIIDHTYVAEQLRGQGIGKQLLKKVVDYARTSDKTIVPLCSYAKHVMLKTDEYKDVLE